jgi:hypothetical protein
MVANRAASSQLYPCAAVIVINLKHGQPGTFVTSRSISAPLPFPLAEVPTRRSLPETTTTIQNAAGSCTINMYLIFMWWLRGIGTQVGL